jgi:SAM-dependent methyltransferase
MHRTEIIQAFIDRIGARVYLEIGVKRGDTFLSIRAPHKIAVDPAPRISRRSRVRSWIRNPRNLFNRYFHVESDAFFSAPPRRLDREGLDIVFVDGLHTHEQSLRDVRNTLRYLNPGGAVLLHDCNPGSEEAASPLELFDRARRTGSWKPDAGWSGDVWKTIVDLRATEPELSVCVLDCDTGIGVVTRGPRPSKPCRVDPDDVAALTYSQLDAQRRELLDLRPPGDLHQLLRSL